MSNSPRSFDMLKSLFLLVIGVSGNFVAETLGCKTQKLLSENMLAKQSVILLILYFTLTFFSSSDVNPSENIFFAIFVWTMYLLFTKMNIEFTIVTFLLLALNYILYTYVDYYKTNNKDNELVNKLEYTYNIINKFLIVFVIVGFLLYFKKQYSEHLKDWSTTEFIFGNITCDSMK